jgi:hypothetical protein
VCVKKKNIAVQGRIILSCVEDIPSKNKEKENFSVRCHAVVAPLLVV